MTEPYIWYINRSINAIYSMSRDVLILDDTVAKMYFVAILL